MNNHQSLLPFPQLRIITSCFAVDAILLGALATYYGTLATTEVITNLTTPNNPYPLTVRLSLFTLAYWVLPVLLYTFFASVKLHALSRGSLGIHPSSGKLFCTNLILASVGFLNYLLFEWLGQSLKDPFSVPTSLVYLSISLSIIGMYTLQVQAVVASFPSVLQGLVHPFKDAQPWKVAIPYISLAFLTLLLMLLLHSTLFSPSIHPQPFLEGILTAATILLPFSFFNAYQWRLIRHPPTNRKS